MYQYSHGGNAAFESGVEIKLDLSANINPLGLPEKVSAAIVSEIPNLTSYPDSSSGALRDAISKFEGVDSSWIFCGNGASDIIFRIPRVVQGKKAMITAPTFSDYERALQSYGADIVYYSLGPDNSFTITDDFVTAVEKEKPDLVYICNPNNPTGRLTESALIGELLKRYSGTMFAIDECFLDFTKEAMTHTSKGFLAQHQNLIILKAFTKMFTMPGIRLGYSLCSSESFNDSLYFHGPDWPVSTLAQGAGIAALEGAEDFVKSTVSYVATERELMERELTKLGYRIFESSTNYVFLQSPFDFDLQEELNKQGIRIRSCNNYHGLDNSYFRIAVTTKENNATLLSAIETITR
ncbi:MAG: aminotransferase class I/II-fold pyridoxal phosphate-dependent enzyme [Oscillospiraceae bacterium]|nr:aminotransferase class I/II-fold pyridoxal phosphate-dependent enzyme [Oscillospiraceae bacterium]